MPVKNGNICIMHELAKRNFPKLGVLLKGFTKFYVQLKYLWSWRYWLSITVHLYSR